MPPLASLCGSGSDALAISRLSARANVEALVGLSSIAPLGRAGWARLVAAERRADAPDQGRMTVRKMCFLQTLTQENRRIIQQPRCQPVVSPTNVNRTVDKWPFKIGVSIYNYS